MPSCDETPSHAVTTGPVPSPTAGASQSSDCNCADTAVVGSYSAAAGEGADVKITLSVPGAEFVILRKVSVFVQGSSTGHVLVDESFVTAAGRDNNMVYVHNAPSGASSNARNPPSAGLRVTGDISVSQFQGPPALPDGYSDHEGFTEYHIAPLTLHAPNYPVFEDGLSYDIENQVAIVPVGGGRRALAAITQKRVALRAPSVKARRNLQCWLDESIRGSASLQLNINSLDADGMATAGSLGSDPGAFPSALAPTSPSLSPAASVTTQASASGSAQPSPSAVPSPSAGGVGADTAGSVAKATEHSVPTALIIGVCAGCCTVVAAVFVAVKLRRVYSARSSTKAPFLQRIQVQVGKRAAGTESALLMAGVIVPNPVHYPKPDLKKMREALRSHPPLPPLVGRAASFSPSPALP